MLTALLQTTPTNKKEFNQLVSTSIDQLTGLLESFDDEQLCKEVASLVRHIKYSAVRLKLFQNVEKVGQGPNKQFGLTPANGIVELAKFNSVPVEYLDKQELAALLRVNERTVRRWVEGGKLPKPVGGNRKQRWRKTDIENLIGE